LQKKYGNCKKYRKINKYTFEIKYIKQIVRSELMIMACSFLKKILMLLFISRFLFSLIFSLAFPMSARAALSLNFAIYPFLFFICVLT